MKNVDDFFVVAYEYPPTTNGEGVVCAKLFNNIDMNFTVCRYIREENECKNFHYSQNMTVYSELLSDYKWIKWAIKTYFLKSKAKIIHTRTMPEHGHIVGVFIKLFKPNVKWIMYFSDPLWNSPYFHKAYKDYSLKKKIDLFFNVEHYRFHMISEFFSKISIYFCNKIVFNNTYLAEYVLGKKYNWLKNKIEIIPYGIDYNSIKNIIPIRMTNEKNILISHIGGVYGMRNFKVVIKALQILKSKNINYYNRIIIRQVGHLQIDTKNEILDSEVSDRFDFFPPTDYYSSLQFMAGSNYLLCIDALLEEVGYNIYVASKIFDYLSVKKPIIAITQSKGPTADIIRYTNNIMIEHCSDSLAKVFISIADGSVLQPNYDKYNDFDCKDGAKLFEKIVNDLM